MMPLPLLKIIKSLIDDLYGVGGGNNPATQQHPQYTRGYDATNERGI